MPLAGEDIIQPLPLQIKYLFYITDAGNLLPLATFCMPD